MGKYDMDEILVTTDADYKDARPIDTVNRIKAILNEFGVDTVEDWAESNVPNCYSLRVNIAGTKVGTNGKGVTKEFALASGYGEFMERLQMGNIWRNKMSFDKGVSAADAQSQPVKKKELLERNPKWYELFSQSLLSVTGISMTPWQLLDQFPDQDGILDGIPYYCVTKDSVEHLPLDLVKAVYGSNGGAAGNTMEEAIVQAISEIVERNHELRVIRDEIPVPEIPENVLQSCPIAYKTIQYLRDNGFRVQVKDCSLGTKFPVVCVSIIETATGKYHTHFGAHPNFEIAVQRTLTETFQGRTLKNVGRLEDFCYTDEDLRNFRRFITEFVLGCSEKKPQFFIRKDNSPYQPCPGFSGSNNQECLRECIAYFREIGYDVLIRDSSCLGFPACQVIIPGYSEIIPHRFSLKFHNYRYRTGATRALRNPTTASSQDLISLMMHKLESNKNRVYGMEGFLAEAGIPALAPTELTVYLMNAAMGYTYYALGKQKEALSAITKMLSACQPEESGYLVCLKRYISMQQTGYAPEDIKKTLEYFHAGETVEKLYSFLDHGTNPFHDLVLRCDMNCGPDCRLYGYCKKPETDRIALMIVEASKKIDQSALAQMFDDV